MSPVRDGPVILHRLYNALWYPALPFALLASGGRDPALRRNRLGYLDPTAAGDPDSTRIWIHAASVGEIEAVRPVIARLMRERTDLAIVLTTMTIAGRNAARRRIPGLAAYQLAPLDFAPAIQSFLRSFKPALILIAETELWPNLFIGGERAGAKIAIVNGRLSARSVRRYQIVRKLIEHALVKADRIFAQTPEDAERFRLLGARSDQIIVTGNTKLGVGPDEALLRPALAGFARGHPMLVAGSTSPGEERVVIDAYRKLVGRHPSLALILAPRHLDRIVEIEKELRTASVSFIKASMLESADGAEPCKVLLLDTMGELRPLYRRAAIAFVGGSLIPGRGGQSLAEPAMASIPVLFGPYHESQRETAEALLASNSSMIVKDSAEMEQACLAWLADDDARRAAGKRAREAIERIGNGDSITADHLLRLLAGK